MSKNYFPAANATIQSYARVFTGALMNTNCVLLHDTEGTSWPDYSGGAVAPQLTGRPNIAQRRIEWRQHYPANRSSRALVNKIGGVETNTLGVFQVELVGTCDPIHAKRWGSLVAGQDYLFWPEAPEWALRDVADMLRWLHDSYPAFQLKDGAPRGWLPYPESYGNDRGQRMTYLEWRHCYGVVGHQHAPENVHGDPGNFPIDAVIRFATEEPAKPAKPTKLEPAHPNADAVLASATRGMAHASKKHRSTFRKIAELARTITTKK